MRQPVATSPNSGPAAAAESSAMRSAGALLDGDTWTGTDAFARADVPTISLQQPASRGSANNPGGAELHSDTGTLVGLEAEARVGDHVGVVPPRQRLSMVDSLSEFAHAQGNDLLILRDYKLTEQGQRDKRSMQGLVLLGIIGLIVLTLVLVVLGVGVNWITEGFGEHLISLVLTAALSGLGGAVAWAFRGASTEQSQYSPGTGLPLDR
jgi:hypothetical protein